jgi:hypothetical protein
MDIPIKIKNHPEFRKALTNALRQFNRSRKMKRKKKVGYIPGPDQLTLKIPDDFTDHDMFRLGMIYGVMYSNI